MTLYYRQALIDELGLSHYLLKDRRDGKAIGIEDLDGEQHFFEKTSLANLLSSANLSVTSKDYLSVYSLYGLTGNRDGAQIFLGGFYPYSTYSASAPRGGGVFYWDGSRAKSGHNGITVISPTVPQGGTYSDLLDFLTGTGETDPSGTGCWVRLYEQMYAYMAGAFGDSSTDDTLALTKTSLINDAVNLGQGVFKITSNIDLALGQSFIGNGAESSKILVSGNGYDAFTLSSNYASLKNLRIYSASSRASGAFVNLTAATHDNFIEDFDFQSCFEGIKVTGTATSTFINKGRIASVTASTGSGIVIAGGNDTFISDLLINSAGSEPKSGINIQKTDAVWLADVDIINSGNPILVNPDGAQGQNVAAIFASQVACDKSDGAGLKIAPTGNAIVKWIFLDNFWASTCLKGVHITTESGCTVDTVCLTDSTIFNNSEHGYLADNTNGGIKGLWIDDSRIGGNSTSSSGGFAGIDIGNDIIGFFVRNNRSSTQGLLTNKQSYGLKIGTGCNDYIVANNGFNGNVTGTVSDGSSSTSTIRNVSGNNGYVTRKNANSTITAGGTSVTVTHGLAAAPRTVNLTPQTNLAGTSFYWNNATATTFDINISGVKAGDMIFSWDASVY